MIDDLGTQVVGGRRWSRVNAVWASSCLSEYVDEVFGNGPGAGDDEWSRNKVKAVRRDQKSFFFCSFFFFFV